MFLRALVLLWSLCCCGALAENRTSKDEYGLRLFGGDSRCRGQLQIWWGGQDRRGQGHNRTDHRDRAPGWTGVKPRRFPLWLGQRVCAELDCGAALTMEERRVADIVFLSFSHSKCEDTSPLMDCFRTDPYPNDVVLQLNCSDSVRLVSGRSLCSGSVQIRDQSLNQSWTSVCEGALDRRGAEVLCRELGCGAPLLQGPLSPLGQMFHCEGHESALMDCPRNQTRTDPGTCPTLNLNCSEPLRLVGGSSRCEGTVEVRHREEWRAVRTSWVDGHWDLETADAVCQVLDCGTALSVSETRDLNKTDQSDVWPVTADCLKTMALRDCVYGHDRQVMQCSGIECRTLDCGTAERRDLNQSGVWVDSLDNVEKMALRQCVHGGGHTEYGSLLLQCSGSVRLDSGKTSCSGSLQIWDESLDQSWTSVCEGALDRRGAEVLCRELGCGAPLLQGALSPLGQTFHCEGHESALMDCPRNQTRTDPETCSTLQLRCSELRLVGGPSRCEGTLEVKHSGEWRRLVNSDPWDLEAVGAVCRDLDCGSAVSADDSGRFSRSHLRVASSGCVKEAAAVADCVLKAIQFSGTNGLQVVCSGHEGPPEETQSSS